jgi:hypothetical protein
MVQFLYTADYADPVPSTGLLHHAQTYSLADKCSILQLKNLARSKLVNEADGSSITHEEDLAAATRYAYENTAPGDNSLRDILVGAIARKMDVYLDDETGHICNLMVEVGEVGRDVARAVRFSASNQQSTREQDPYPSEFYYRSYRTCWLVYREQTQRTWLITPACPQCEDIMEERTLSYTAFHSWWCASCSNAIKSSCQADWDSVKNTWKCCYCSSAWGFRAQK